VNNAIKLWGLVEVLVPNEHEELASWCLMQISGATGCEVIPAGEERVLIKASFEQESISPEQLELIAQFLVEHGLEHCVETLRSGNIEQQDWLAKWKENFRSFKVGDRITICPPWERNDTVSGADPGVVLVIDPAMAFGTGLHATTQFCLRAIQTAKLGPSVLDVGTGSGILAIAAVLLNDNISVTAIDNDPVAIDAARRNCSLNNVGDRIELIVGSTESVAGRRFDAILSNLTCEDIISLLPSYRQLLASGGAVICAGVLAEKQGRLEAAIPHHGFSIERAETEGMWCGLILRRN